jgi:hypothetical protein
VDGFFDKVEELKGKHSFSPSGIFNADKTGVSVVQEEVLRVLSVKGKKQVGMLPFR